MNKTNASTCTLAFGSDDTDDWIGQEILLGAEPVSFRGNTTMGLRLGIDQQIVSDDEEPPF